MRVAVQRQKFRSSCADSQALRTVRAFEKENEKENEKKRARAAPLASIECWRFGTKRSGPIPSKRLWLHRSSRKCSKPMPGGRRCSWLPSRFNTWFEVKGGGPGEKKPKGP
jgi:hypothetical protein